jgi:hypothetical protein
MRAGVGRMRLRLDVQAEDYDNLSSIVLQVTGVVYSSEMILQILSWT